MVIRGQGEHILVIDDEEAVRDVTRKILIRLGYQVIATGDSRVALELFRKDPDAFSLILTDQTMPHLTGLEMAREMLHIRPGLPVILCSGYSDQRTDVQAGGQGIQQFLRKPIRIKALAEAVACAINQARAGKVLEK